MTRISVHEVISTVLDPDTFSSWDTPPVQPDYGPQYAAQLARATQRSSADEAVVTGGALIGGYRVAVIVGDFDFLAGSLGAAASERITLAFERATAEGLPVLASPMSGGTRMQEGTPAFLHMIKISQAVLAHRAAGLPYLVYLRDPTTGGALASWGSLGHLTIAQPGALVGLLGPRVREIMLGEPLPEGVQRSESLARKGVIDGVVPLRELRTTAVKALRVLTSPQEPVGERFDAEGIATDRAPWDSVQATRNPERPRLHHLLHHAAEVFIPLRGTGTGESDGTITVGLVRFPGLSCVLIGQDRRPRRDASLSPAALRVAQRGFHLAEELDLPLVTVIDSPGPELTTEAEHGGLAGEIARTVAALATVRVPVVSTILGEGNGVAALALLPADRTVCAENGWVAPLPPEGASAIIHRTADRAADMAAAHRIRAVDLLEMGAVNEIVPERPDAAEEPAEFCRRLIASATAQLAELVAMKTEERLRIRHDRYRSMT
ncbi:carboxyl transferase domain-containing protein [Pseudactinotalea sp. Z1748]|uniref:carboxyl transferase domain-containing protein n=1 Tax=Pseudactinotalea sp. Z1748 TaxID=3413027 RepID=UPI003C7B83D7